MVRCLPVPKPDPPAATLSDVTAAFEEVIAANAAVRLRGSAEVLEAADALVRASSEFVDYVLQSAPLRKWRKTPPALDARLEEIDTARQQFLKVVREEAR